MPRCLALVVTLALFAAGHSSAVAASLPASGPDQSAYPFLRFGKPVPTGNAGYGVLTARRDTLAACRDPQTGMFDWGGLTSLNAVEVCLFRAAAAFGAPDLFRDWMVSQGFDPQLRTSGRNLAHLYNRADETLTFDSFRWRRADQGDLFGPTARQQKNGAFITDIHVVWDAGNLPVSVSTTTQGRWSE